MSQSTIGSTRWLMSAVSQGLLKGFATLVFIGIVASLVAGILPLGGFSSVPGLFVAVGIAGYYWWENWPPWPPKAIRKVDELPRREKIEQAAKDARDPREIAKAVSFVDPADVAEAISLLEADASRFPIDELNHVSFVINAGIQVPGDAEQVLAQLVRLEGDDVEELVFDRLFNLYEAADSDTIGRLKQRARIAALKRAAENRGALAGLLAMLGARNRDATAIGQKLAGLEHEELAPKHDVTKIGTMSAMESFAVILPPPPRHFDLLIENVVEFHMGTVRGSGAFVLGGIGRANPEMSQQVTQALLPLIEDTDKECRIGAVQGLAGPAVHHEEALETLRAIAAGDSKQFAYDTDLREAAQQVLESDPYRYDPTADAERANDGDGSSPLTI
jgi:hypothetical protein